MLAALLLSSTTSAWSYTDLTIDRDLSFRIPSTDNCRDAKGAYARVESMCLDVLTHAVGEGVGWDGSFVEAPPLRGFISGAGNEVTTVGEET